MTDDPADELYRLPLDAFVEARNALSARLRAGGDKGGAARVKALVRPSVPAWAVNQMFWTARDDFDAFLAASAGLHASQADGATGDVLRDAAKARREALGKLLRRAESILGAAGHGASASTMQRVSNTLEALAAPGDRPPEATPGRVLRELEPPGFEALAGGLAPRARPTLVAPTPLTPRDSAEVPTAASDAAVAEARQVLADAERQLDRARQEARTAAGELSIAQTRAEGARSELAEAMRRLERARERAALTEADEAAARDRADRLVKAREQAEVARDVALRDLRAREKEPGG